jgi:hypothetical protein
MMVAKSARDHRLQIRAENSLGGSLREAFTLSTEAQYDPAANAADR